MPSALSLNKEINLNTWPLIYCAIAAIFFIPFVLISDTLPIPGFYNEIATFSIATALLFFYVIQKIEKIEVTEAIITPFILMAICLYQFLIVKSVTVETFIIVSSYMLLAIAMMIIGSAIAKKKELTLFFDRISWVIVIGAVPNIIQEANHFSSASDLGIGNIGQANLNCTFIFISSIALFYLLLRKKIYTSVFFVALAVFSFEIALTASKNAFLFFLFFLAGVNIYRKKENKQEINKLFVFMLIFFAFYIFWQILFILNDIHSAIGRLNQGVDGLPNASFARRFIFWRYGLEIFYDNLFIGAGFNNFDLEFFYKALNDSHIGIYTRVENSHNVLINFLAETGVIGTLALIVPCLMAFIRIFRSEWKLDKLIPLSIILIVGIHSLTEYPLWIAEFLAIFSFAIGILDSKNIVIRKTCALIIVKIISFFVIALAVIIILSVQDNFKNLESIAGNGWLDRKINNNDKITHEVIKLSNHGLLSPYGVNFMCYKFDFSNKFAKEKESICRNAVLFEPIPFSVYKYATYLTYNGNLEKASYFFTHAVAAYPKEIGWFVANINLLNQDDLKKLLPVLLETRFLNKNIFKPEYGKDGILYINATP